MYVDNLTIAGLASAFVYTLLPLFFGRETLRVDESAETPISRRAASEGDGIDHPHPCSLSLGRR
jgi:hypothetical protein